jgi:hypothetical protein
MSDDIFILIEWNRIEEDVNRLRPQKRMSGSGRLLLGGEGWVVLPPFLLFLF